MNHLSTYQKREYLHLLLTEGKEAARTYLENTVCEGGVFVYKTREEADAFREYLNGCCPDGTTGAWFFIPDNGRGGNRKGRFADLPEL